MGVLPNGHANHESTPSEMELYIRSLPRLHLEPLWTRMSAMVPPAPNPRARPHLWSYRDCYPALAEAGRRVSETEAERRVLMLVNPAMNAPHTTDTLYAGLQLVKPNEVAPAHRHVAFAVRFIIDDGGGGGGGDNGSRKGTGSGFTAVEGRRMRLARGDVVVTPTWHWHDHGNDNANDTPVVWLDVLNLPLFTFARVNFAQSFAESRYPSEHDDSAAWCHAWKKTQDALDSDSNYDGDDGGGDGDGGGGGDGDGASPSPFAIYHYRDADGKPLSTTIGVQAERISPGRCSRPSRSISSFIYHCHQGQGHTVIIPPPSSSSSSSSTSSDDHTTSSSSSRIVFSWRARDTFAVPAWSTIQHFNESCVENAYLVAFHDGPLLDNLGLRASIGGVESRDK